jgi:3-isopropylmalate/(R)-2-methylmalate dehydratase small subunit
MSTNERFEARTWTFGDHINTDLILPGPVMLLPFDEQPQYVFQANRPGWAKQVRSGDILIGGHNFGTGSGRPAARSLKVVGINCLVAESINGLFFRNCINYGLYPMECPGVSDLISEGDIAAVDYSEFVVRNLTTGEELPGKRFPEMLLDILRAEGIYPLMESQGLLELPNPETA